MSLSFTLKRLVSGSLWHRHALWSMTCATLSALLGLFIFYICLDASMNSSQVGSMSLLGLSQHYWVQFLKRLPQLLPFAITMTATHTLLRMQRQYETLSLTMSGASRLSILRPFLKVGLVSALVVFACTEGWFFAPTALRSAQTSPLSWLTSSWLSNTSEQFEALPLDHDLKHWLVYHHFDSQSRTFYNVFWIENDASWWHFDTLQIAPQSDESLPTSKVIGTLGDHFEKKTHDLRVWSSHHPSLEMTLEMTLKQLTQEARGPQELPAVDLWKALKGDFPQIQRPRLRAYLYYRLIQPFLCVFAILAAATLTLSHKRHSHAFWAYLTAIFALVALFMIQQAGLVLASAGRMHPMWGLLAPTLFAFCFVSYFIKRN